MCYFYFGLLILLTVFSLGHAQVPCKKQDAQKIFNEIKQSMPSAGEDTKYLELFLKMKEKDQDLHKNLFFCDENEKLLDKWDKLQEDLLEKVKKSCPNFEKDLAEMSHCRQILDAYNMKKEQKQYCSNFDKCTKMRESFCAPMKEIVFLNNRQSNASVYFCTLDCDNIPALRDNLRNCWASIHLQEESSSVFERFSGCALLSIKSTCKITKEFLSHIFPLFSIASHEIKPEPESGKNQSKCFPYWNDLKKISHLDPSMCKMLEEMEPCITKFMKGSLKLYKLKIAKCQYSLVNLIKTEALHQTTVKPTSAPSIAAGKMGSGAYHLILICWLVTMVSCYFSNII